MKKITLLFFMSLLSFTGFAQLELEDFEGNGNALPTDWLQVNVAGPAQQWVVASHNAAIPSFEGVAGTHAAYLNRETVAPGTTTEDWLITPEFPVPTAPQLRFYSRLTQGGDQGSTYRVMINTAGTTDPDDFVELQNWTELTINPSQETYTEIVVELPVAEVGNDVRLAFVMNGNNGDRWLVDMVKVVEQCLEPEDLGVGTIGLNTAELEWENPAGATEFEVEVVGALEIPVGSGEEFTFEGDPYVADGLTESTDYKFYVRTICADGNSDWAGPFYFSTVALGATCGAPIVIDALSFSDTNNTAGYGDDYDGSPGASGCGTTSGYLNGDDVVYAYEADFTGTISVDLTNNGTYSGVFVYDDCDDIGEECIGGGVTSFIAEPISYEVQVTEGTTYYFVISTWGAFPQTTPYTLIIQVVNCDPPVGLPTENIGQTSAELSWTNPTGATAWEVVVQAPGEGIPSGAGEPTDTNDNYLADGLVAATPYEYYVRADCGDGTFSAWAGPYLFNTTICEAVDQCTYTFVMTDTFGDGWNGNTMTVAQNGITVATLGPTFTTGTGPVEVTVNLCHDLPFTLYWNAGGSFAGEVGVSIVNSFDQTIYTKAPGTGIQNSLLYSGDADCVTPECLAPENLIAEEITTFTAELSWSGGATGEWEYYVVEAGEPAPGVDTEGELTDTNPTLVEDLDADTDYEFYVRVICDTGEISGWGGPHAFTTLPTCPQPIDLVVNSTGLTEAELQWTEVASADEWEVYIVEAGEPAPTEDSVGVLTNSNPYTALLDQATVYEYYVRAVCSDDDLSQWSGPVEFNTLVCLEDDQCSYVFELTDSFGDGWNGNTMTVSQNGVTMAILGPTFTTGTGPVTVLVPLCPGVDFELFWNSGGSFAGEVGITVYTPFLEDIYTKAPGTGSQNTLLYTGEVDCTPPPCPKPQDLEVSDITVEGATLTWTEMGGALEWEVWVLPTGSPEPTAGDGDGVVVTEADLPYIVNDLDSGTAYDYYVIALCGDEDGNSNLSGPVTFVTAIENDDCEDAVVVPVNPGIDCDEIVGGTLTGSTGSGIQPSCSWMMPEYDVWFQFTATATTHSINIGDQVGPFLNHAVYEGDDCGSMTEIICEFDGNSNLNGLTIGNTYFVQVYTTFFANPSAPSSFNICIRTPEPPISVSDDEFTLEELVQDVLIGSDCAIITNITSSSGLDFGSSSSIGYFNQNGSSFPFEEGIVLATGAITEAPGPYPGAFSGDAFDWPGDDDLQDIIAEGGNLNPLYNATVLEFDFVPLTDEISFDFLFASNEYGTFQCNYSDAFAFILTPLSTPGDAENLAVIPGTDIPVSVVTIRDNAYNGICDSQNVEYFDQYNPNDPDASAIGYAGQTVVMQATAPVVQGQSYHIKMVIADYQDSGVNSAVFLAGGSFDLGEVPFPDDLTVEGGNAVCAGGEYVLNTNLEPDDYEFTWYEGDDILDGETGPTLTVIETGDYAVSALYVGSTCAVEGEVRIEFYDDIEVITEEPNNLTVCDASGFAEFDLSQNDAAILEGLNADDYTLTYYLTEEAAEDGTGTALPTLYTNEVQFEQTIYVRIFNEVTGCFGVKSFELIIQDLTPVFTLTEDVTICEGESVTLTVTPDNFDPESEDVTFTWTLDGGAPLAETGSSITVTEGGDYEVTIDNNGCDAIGTVTVIVAPAPTADDPDDVLACGSYTLPALSADNSYYTETMAGGIELFESDVITSTQTIYVYATGVTPDCTDENSFVVTIVPSPVIEPIADVTACENYTLPALATGDYYTEANGGGTMLNANDVITTSQTVYVYAESGTTPNCTAEDSFEITIVPSVTADAPQDVAVCDSYTLPALSAGNNYYTGTGGTGEMLTAGEVLIDTQTVYVYAQAGDCTDENSFNVVIIPTPEIAITDGCEENDYILEAIFVDEIYTEDNVTYTWTMNGTPVGGDAATLTITEPGTYEVTVTPVGTADCPITATLEIDDTTCTVQRGISPNNDGLNDNFDLSSLDVRKLSIYNRYGQEIYSYGNYTDEWYGQSSDGNEVPTGTYFYMIERANGENRTGWIYVNREEN